MFWVCGLCEEYDYGSGVDGWSYFGGVGCGWVDVLDEGVYFVCEVSGCVEYGGVYE